MADESMKVTILYGIRLNKKTGKKYIDPKLVTALGRGVLDSMINLSRKNSAPVWFENNPIVEIGEAELDAE